MNFRANFKSPGYLILKLSLMSGSEHRSKMRTGFNLSVDQLHNILISKPCEEGKYRDSSMTSCDKCDAGKEPNTDKTDCGKKNLLTQNTLVLL